MDAAANLPPPDSSAPNGGHGAKAFLVGGGIASLAAAAFMVRDGGVPGPDITILEGLGTVGGSLDGAGSPEHGYVLRGGRMLEAKYLCTFGLFAGIPTLDAALNGGQSVTQEIEAWNRARPTSSRARLVRNGHREDAPRFGLHERHIMTIERLVLEPETLLGHTTIAFQPWHGAFEFKRYLARFAHLVTRFERLEGIMRAPLNQYDSLARPPRNGPACRAGRRRFTRAASTRACCSAHSGRCTTCAQARLVHAGLVHRNEAGRPGIR